MLGTLIIFSKISPPAPLPPPPPKALSTRDTAQLCENHTYSTEHTHTWDNKAIKMSHHKSRSKSTQMETETGLLPTGVASFGWRQCGCREGPTQAHCSGAALWYKQRGRLSPHDHIPPESAGKHWDRRTPREGRGGEGEGACVSASASMDAIASLAQLCGYTAPQCVTRLHTGVIWHQGPCANPWPTHSCPTGQDTYLITEFHNATHADAQPCRSMTRSSVLLSKLTNPGMVHELECQLALKAKSNPMGCASDMGKRTVMATTVNLTEFKG